MDYDNNEVEDSLFIKGYDDGYDDGYEFAKQQISHVLDEMATDIGRFSSDVFLGTLSVEESVTRIELIRKYMSLLDID